MQASDLGAVLARICPIREVGLDAATKTVSVTFAESATEEQKARAKRFLDGIFKGPAKPADQPDAPASEPAPAAEPPAA